MPEVPSCAKCMSEGHRELLVMKYLDYMVVGQYLAA
jgi:hypothetical protein